MISINEERLRNSFEQYSAIGSTDNGGLNRVALTDADKKARDRFISDLEDLGLDIRIDEVGNIFGRRKGKDPEADPVLIGSHLDSQPYGGKYDGQLGVLTALETLRTLEDNGIQTERPIEIVNWTNEEGARFQHAMLGSAVFTEKTNLEEALELTDKEGIRLGDELNRIGYAGDDSIEIENVHSHVELHIEQGPQLEEHDNSIGVVDGVYGIAWLRATIHGNADHAGPSPMHTRQDAMAAAASAVDEINTLPNRLSPDAIATVGEFTVEPNSVNVIPDLVEFTVDVRSYKDDVVQEAVNQTEAELQSACQRYGTEYEIEEMWRVPSTTFSPKIRDVIDEAAESVNTSYEHLTSGAGHDAKYVHEIAPTAMVFVPSVDGITHNEAEYTEWKDCVAGAEVYANAVLKLANK